MRVFLSQEQIDVICEAHRLVDMPTDIATHLCRAQAQHLLAVLEEDCLHSFSKRKRHCILCIQTIRKEVGK